MLLSLDLTGHYRAGVGPFRVYRAAWVLWIFWSLALMALYATAIRLHLTGGEERARLPKPAARPGFLWVAVMLVVLNGLSQYLGLKTESHSPELQRAIKQEQYITYFELRRIISTRTGDFEVTYRRDGEEHRYVQRGGASNDHALAMPHNPLLAKILFFRPVPKSVRCPCQH